MLRSLVLTSLLSACAPDDDGSRYDTAPDTGPRAGDGNPDDGSDTDGDTDAGTDGGPTDPLVGAWVSQGTDLAPLFRNAFFDYQRIDSDFETDGTYAVLVTLNDGSSVTLTGTWSSDTSTQPHGIVVVQTAPEAVTSTGIYRVQGDTLTYEIAAESAGCTPPTPAGGFGSSSCPGLSAGDLTQTYRAR